MVMQKRVSLRIILNVPGGILRKWGFENLTLTGHDKNKRDTVK